MTTAPASTRISDVRTVGVPGHRPGAGAGVLPRRAGVRERASAHPSRAAAGSRWPRRAGRRRSRWPPSQAGELRRGVDTGVRFTTADAAADHAALSAAGVRMDGEVLHFPGVPPMFSFHDPDGNTLYVVEQA